MPLEIFLVGPLLALAVLALIAVAADLRSHRFSGPGRSGRSRRAGDPGRSRRAGDPGRAVSAGAAATSGEFGLLRPVALAADVNAARSVRNRLMALGIRATVGTGRDGLVQVLVFDDEYDRARDAV